MRPIGLAYISAYLRAHGHKVATYDFSNSVTAPSVLVDDFDLGRFQLVGLSFYNINAAHAYALARAIKDVNPHCIVVAGGPHPSAADTSLLRRHPEIDVVARNEGEETFLEIVEAVRCGKGLRGIPGISHRNGAEIIREVDRPRLADLDSLPAPVTTFLGDQQETPLFFPEDPEPYLKRAGRTRDAVAMITSRSCPYNCSFCAIILIGRDWRAAGAEKVVSDFVALDQAAGGRYEHIYFMDANFFVDVRRAVRIGEALQRTKPGLTFSFSTRVNQIIRGKAYLERLCELGLRSIEVGIESASPAALERYAKDVVPEQNEEALAIMRSLGLKLGLDFINFDAEATTADLRLNLDFFERNGLDTYMPWDHIFSYMTPYLGTPIRTRYESILGREFDEDTLPNPLDLIIDPSVKHIFQEIHRLLPFTNRMTEAVDTIERRCFEEPWGRETARLMLNAVTLRRFCHSALRNLVDAAQRGRLMPLEQAMPSLRRDDGTPISLEEMLDYALQRN